MSHIGLTAEELQYVQTLLANLDAAPGLPGDATERRHHPRFDFKQPIWLNLPLEPGRPWMHVFSRNLSTSGLAFITRDPLARSARVVIAHHFAESVPQLVLCRVNFCRPIAPGYCEVGVVFETAVPDPQERREIPAAWYSQVLRSTWVVRKMDEW